MHILILTLEKRFNLMSYLLGKKLKFSLNTYNRRKIIKSIKSLKKICFKNIDLKIYIVDDGSIDEHLKIKKNLKM